MKLKVIRINNVFQHENVVIPCDGHLIGLVGPNGSGKSNLLKCIQFAFSGEVPGKNKDQLLMWGARSGNVTIEFTHQGKDGAITRATGSGKTHLSYNGEKYTGITKVNNAVDALFGMDKNVARTVFVAQSDLESILFETPAKREQAFQRMVGMGESEKVYKDLGAWISSKMPPIFDTSEQIAAGKAEIEELGNIETQVEAALDGINEKLQVNDMDSLRAEQQVLSDIQKHCSTLIDLESDVKSRKDNEMAVQEARNKLASQIEGIDFDKLDAKLSSARKKLSEAEEYSRLVAEADRKKKDLENLGDCPVSPEEAEKTRKEVQASTSAYDEIKGISNLYSSLLRALESSGEDLESCPVCGSVISDKESVTTRLKNLLEEKRKEIENLGLDSKKKKYNELSKDLEVWQSRKHNLEGQLESSKSAVSNREKPESDVDNMRQELARMEAVGKQLQQIRVDVAGYDAQLASSRKEIQNIEDRIRAARSSLESLGCDDPDIHKEFRKVSEELVENGSKMNECTALLQQKANHDGRLKEIRERIASLSAGVEKMVRQNEQNADYENAKATLEKVREWLHYSNGPHKLSVRIMENLSDTVNMFLTKLNSPFYVSLKDDGMSYACPFTDGRAMPESGAPDASELSGGQKAILATAFRLASYCMFASQQGLLTLDEPSAALDRDNVDNFCTMLDKLKEVMVQLDLQIFISTHEQAILPFCDNVANLYDKDSLAA